MLFISSLSAFIVSRRSLSFFVAEHDFTPNPDNDAMTDIKRNTEISFHVVDDSESSIAQSPIIHNKHQAISMVLILIAV